MLLDCLQLVRIIWISQCKVEKLNIEEKSD